MPWRGGNGIFVASFEGRSSVTELHYWSNSFVQKAIANLRAFAAPTTNYFKCPLTRRAAVLILLIADRKGDLRVVLTVRSSGLKNCSFTYDEKVNWSIC